MLASLDITSLSTIHLRIIGKILGIIGDISREFLKELLEFIEELLAYADLDTILNHRDKDKPPERNESARECASTPSF